MSVINRLFATLFTTLFGGYLLTACSAHHDGAVQGAVGGGRDAVTIHMPFAAGYDSQCVQGVGGGFSHSYTSTFYDIDLDTPNDRNDFLYAPVGGTAYVHESEDGFGTHINIDLGDGTYIVLGHFSTTFIEYGEEVAAGQILGFEGATGAATGDHVHIGRHEGDAWNDAGEGVSVSGLSFQVYDHDARVNRTVSVEEFNCDLYDGSVYRSRLETPLWHPDGTLIKTPESSEVYLVDEGVLRHIVDEEVFWSYNYAFDDLAVVDLDELACYEYGDEISREGDVRALYDAGDVWLLTGQVDDADRQRSRVKPTAWQATLKSWGISASTYDDIPIDDALLDLYPDSGEEAVFRDGTIVSEVGSSDVYFISNGVAMPIYDWETFLLLDLYHRDLMEVDDGAVEVVQGRVGDCASGSYCLTRADVLTCAYGESGDTFTADGGREDEEEDDATSADDSDEGASTEEGSDTGASDETCVDTELADDLSEELSWLRVNDAWLGLRVGEVFSGSDVGELVAVTGVGVDDTWSYNPDHLASYDSETDMAWYDFSDGWYRITMRTSDEWANYWELCLFDDTASSLCHENRDGSFALCFEVFDDELFPMSSEDCRSME